MQVHGHRGAKARWPENTIDGFRYAIGLGVDGIELDIAVTRDDELVLSHDPDIDGVAIRSTSRPNLPTLDEVLELARLANFEFDLEIKSFPDRPELTPPPERFAELVLAAIVRHGVSERVNVLSFDFRTLRAMRELAPEIRRSALYIGLPRPFVEIAKEAGNTPIVSPHYTLVTPEQVAEAHGHGIRVLTWTANTPQDWDRLIAAGVDGIITDDPEALIEYLCANKT